MADETESMQPVRDAIESEGFDYCFRMYSNFPEIGDPDFHHLRRDYVNAAKALEDYVDARSTGEMDEEECE